MAPRTRSQTTYYRTPDLSSDNLDNQFQAASLQDDGDPHPVEESLGISAWKDPEVRETRGTPRPRKNPRTVDKYRREAALKAYPNNGRCLITNLAGPAVQLCHLVSMATSKQRDMITQLEYVWEMGYNQFNIDTRYNTLYLRADWHSLFDQDHWALVPEYNVLLKLRKIYLDDRRPTCNMEELFEEKPYRYYFLPAPTLQDPICRFMEVNNPYHETHIPPFANFKSVESHVHPHFVIFNTGKKLATLGVSLDAYRMEMLLHHRVSPLDSPMIMFHIIRGLYDMWTTAQVPGHFFNTAGNLGRSYSPSESEPPPSNITITDDGTDWIEVIHEWREQIEGGSTAEMQSDISDDIHDEQLAAYSKEHARTPPSPAAWEYWRPEWVEFNSQYLTEKDRARFSSNDWALFVNDIYLTRPEYP